MADSWRDQLDNLIDVQAGDPNFYWEGQQKYRWGPGSKGIQGDIETNLPPVPRAPTGVPGPQSGAEDPDAQDKIFGYLYREDDGSYPEGQDPRDIPMVGAGRNRIGLPPQRQFPSPGDQPDIRLPPKDQAERDVKQYGGPRPLAAPPEAPATKASDKPRQPGWEAGKLPPEYQPYTFFPQGKEQWYAPQGGRPLGVGRGTADPEMRKYMMNMPSMNQLRSRTGINFPEQAQPDESGRRSMPLTPQIQDQLQKSGDFERMMPYVPKPKPEDIEKIPMSQDQPKVWEAQLDDMLGGDGASHVPQSTWRTMLDNLNPIGTAHAAPMQRVPGGERERGPGFYPGEWPQLNDDDDQMEIRSDATPIPTSPTEDRPQPLPNEPNAYPNLPQSREVRTAKKRGPNDIPMEEWPATADEFKTKFGRDPQTEQEKKFYSDDEPAAPKPLPPSNNPEAVDWGPPVDVNQKLAEQGNYDPNIHRLGPNGPIPYSEGWRGQIERMTEPLNPHVWGRDIKEEWKKGTEQTAQGLNEIVGGQRRPGQTRRGQITQGAADTGLGALRAATSPATGVYHSIVGDPLQRTTGLPRWASDLGMMAIPGIGIPRAPGLRVPGTQTVRSGMGLGPKVENVPNWAQNQYVQRALPGMPGPSAGPGEVSAFKSTQPGGMLSQTEKIFSPETAQLSANDAAKVVREFSGVGAREVAQTAHKLEQHSPTAINVPPTARVLGNDWKTRNEGLYKNAATPEQAEQWNWQNYLDGGKSAVAPTGEAKAMLDDLKPIYQAAKGDLQKLPEGMQLQFREQFFPHYWKEDVAPELDSMTAGGKAGGRQGSLATLTRRKHETIEDGLRAGKIPKWDNPLESTMRYAASVSKAKVWNNILEEGKNMGMVVRGDREPVGSSGVGAEPRVEADQQDWYTRTILDGQLKGYVELQGRGGRGWFAPEGFARVYNNAISQGFEATDVGPFAEALRKASNGATQTLLSFSGYHFMTMSEATMNTNLARAARNIKEGDYAKGFALGMSTPGSIVPYAYRGKHWMKVYLEPNAEGVTDADREVMDYLVRGGDRVGSRHALDIGSSKMDDWVTAMKKAGGWQTGARGSWQGLKQVGRNIRQPYREAGGGLKGTAASAMSAVGQAVDTMNRPLFQTLIPSLKAGVKGELMSDFLKANPLATDGEKLAEARRLVDSIDNRFGEMIQDNIFWNRMLKQGMTAAMLSYSWNVGGWREVLGGGVRDIARFAAGTGAWTPKATYTVSMAINQAMLASMYQKLKTGQAPWETDTPFTDMMAPRTGGTLPVWNPETGKSEESDARLLVPGLHKDFYGYFEHPMTEAMNKMNVLMKTAGAIGSGHGWDVGPNDPIFDPQTGLSLKGFSSWKVIADEGAKTAQTNEEKELWNKIPVWLGNAYDYVERSMLPISAQQQFGRGQPPAGSGLTWERALGGRLAPSQFQNPYHDTSRKFFEQKEWNEYMGRKLSKERKTKARTEEYGGPQ